MHEALSVRFSSYWSIKARLVTTKKIGQTILWTNDHVAPNILLKPDDETILTVFL